MKNCAGHRLSPWLGHLMISRQETARPLVTAGEVMQLPPTDELVLVSACHPIRAKKAGTTRTRGSKPASIHRPRWPLPTRAPPAVGPIGELTTGAISRFQRQSKMRLGRSPALSPIKIPRTTPAEAGVDTSRIMMTGQDPQCDCPGLSVPRSIRRKLFAAVVA